MLGTGILGGVTKALEKQIAKKSGVEAAETIVREITKDAEKIVETAGRSGAVAPVSKFSDYIFKEGATHGKDTVFNGLGYGREQSTQLAQIWEQQAAAKFAKGEYTLGKLDQYGQRIEIEIEVHGIGNAAGKSSYMKSGWMMRSDGGIKLNTPFTGFTR